MPEASEVKDRDTRTYASEEAIAYALARFVEIDAERDHGMDADFYFPAKYALINVFAGFADRWGKDFVLGVIDAAREEFSTDYGE